MKDIMDDIMEGIMDDIMDITLRLMPRSVRRQRVIHCKLIPELFNCRLVV